MKEDNEEGEDFATGFLEREDERERRENEGSDSSDDYHF